MPEKHFKNVQGMLYWEDPRGEWHLAGGSRLLAAYPRIMKKLEPKKKRIRVASYFRSEPRRRN